MRNTTLILVVRMTDADHPGFAHAVADDAGVSPALTSAWATTLPEDVDAAIHGITLGDATRSMRMPGLPKLTVCRRGVELELPVVDAGQRSGNGPCRQASGARGSRRDNPRWRKE